MTAVWFFLHIFGFTLWLGGAFAAFAASIAAKHEDRASLGAVVRAQSLMFRLLIGPGALLATLGGLMLTFRNSAARFPGADFWLILMQGCGIVAALITLFVNVPTAARLGRLEPAGKSGPYFDELRARQRLVSSLSGVLGLLALLGGVMVAHGA